MATAVTQNSTPEIQMTTVPVIIAMTPPDENTTHPNLYLPPARPQQGVKAGNTQNEDDDDEEEKTNHTAFHVAYYILCLVMSILLTFPLSKNTIEWALSPSITYIVIGSLCCLSKNKARYLLAFEICLFLSTVVKDGIYGIAFVFAIYGVFVVLSLLVPSLIICCVHGCLDTENDKKTMSKVVTILFLLDYVGTSAVIGYNIGDLDLNVLSLGIILFLCMFFLHISVACDTETIDSYFCHFANAYLCIIGYSCFQETRYTGFVLGMIGCVLLYITLFYIDYFRVK